MPWTRLAPEPLAADGHGGMPLRQVPVQYEVTEDERFRRIARPGSPLKPSYPERPLPAELFRAGKNVLELHKDEGSWIAYDAIGVFARRG
ncbi:hypothetical protein AB0L13_27075 [Saccharopolyspora shandongensis]|uniref:hypothetical protein n=1 Tax=Saccharopolyspora shandongensis TaxID=418495 RepID=UPI003437F97C